MYPFERFTDSAKTALTLAQEEAERSHHSYIGTEHLLLGLLREEDGRASKVLEALGVQAGAVRATIQAVLGRNERIIIQQIIPTSRVKKVIEIAFEQARQMGDDHVGTEHLLLGLLIEGEGIASHVLIDLGAGLDEVRGQLRATAASWEPATERAPSAQSPWREAVRLLRTMPADDARMRVVGELVVRALTLADERGEVFGTEHMLLALAEQGSTKAGEMLARHGLTTPEVIRILEEPPLT